MSKKEQTELSEKEQIEKLKDVALQSYSPSVSFKTIDTMAIYGEKAIPALTEIAKKSMIFEVQERAVDKIREIKERS